MPVVPFTNFDTQVVLDRLGITERIQNPDTQRKLVLVTVCIALLLDNMLYMVIVPIIPVYLRSIGNWKPPVDYWWDDYNISDYDDGTTKTKWHPHTLVIQNQEEDASIGILFASKAIVQLIINPLSGSLIDKYGYDRPMFFGLTVMFFSTSIFAFGTSYSVLFIARGLQGLGSAFADTSGLAMIADRYTDEHARNKALGIALAFISFGCLFAPPFGGILYEFGGKCVPFLLLALLCLIDGALLLIIMQPVRKERDLNLMKAEGTPIWRLIIDPFIAVCAGGLVMANVSLAFLEPTIALWMKDKMNASEWEIGMVWLPAFFPHVIGVFTTVKLMKMYPNKHWLIVAVGLCLEGVSCLLLPFCNGFAAVVVPICIDCFGIALVDTAVLPTLAYLVDVRHTSVYGSVYAIADISYSLAYAFGPIVAGSIVAKVGFTWLNVGIFLSNILYAPIFAVLRKINEYKPFENEADTIIPDTAPQGQYKTYIMSSETGTTPKEILPEKNHLDMSRNIQIPAQDGYQVGYNQIQGPVYTTKTNTVQPQNRFNDSDSDNDFRPHK